MLDIFNIEESNMSRSLVGRNFLVYGKISCRPI